jgi:hypothetical protein
MPEFANRKQPGSDSVQSMPLRLDTTSTLKDEALRTTVPLPPRPVPAHRSEAQRRSKVGKLCVYQNLTGAGLVLGF